MPVAIEHLLDARSASFDPNDSNVTELSKAFSLDAYEGLDAWVRRDDIRLADEGGKEAGLPPTPFADPASWEHRVCMFHIHNPNDGRTRKSCVKKAEGILRKMGIDPDMLKRPVQKSSRQVQEGVDHEWNKDTDSNH